MPRGYKNPVSFTPPVKKRDVAAAVTAAPENSGLATDYYLCPVNNPHRAEEPYIAECGDIIEALGMTFNEGTAFKAIWRKAAERTLGMKKAGNDAKRDAEKVKFYGGRMLSEITGKKL